MLKTKTLIIIAAIVTLVFVNLYFVYLNSTPVIETITGYRFGENVLPEVKDNYDYIYSRSDIRHFKDSIRNLQENQRLKDNRIADTGLIREVFQSMQITPVKTINTDVDTLTQQEILKLVREIDAANLRNEPVLVPGFTNIDTQNIHDSHVQKQTANDYRDLLDTVTETTKDTFNKVSSSIIDYMSQLFPETQNSKKDRVKAVLDKIAARNAKVVSYNTTETDIIKNIWEKSNDSVKRELINQLNDCMDTKGDMYCPTGVGTRVIESIYITEPERYPKTKRALNEEMYSTAAAIRRANGNLTGPDLKSALINRYKKDYVDTGILTEQELGLKIGDWIDHV